jgi:hypothetical protein
VFVDEELRDERLYRHVSGGAWLLGVTYLDDIVGHHERSPIGYKPTRTLSGDHERKWVS